MRVYRPSAFLGLSLDVVQVFSQAIGYCAEKLNKSSEETLALLEQGDLWVHSTFRFALAVQICPYLGRLGTAVRSIYIYGSCMEDRAKPTSDIDMIIWANEKNDAITFLLERLNLLVSSYYKSLLGDKASAMRWMLDIHVVDDQEVQENIGYATVLRSLYTMPVKIWNR
jgi:predicted nucleotidyltransferase